MQTRLNVLSSLLETQSGGFASKRDPLLDLAQFWQLESRFKFRLAGQHDLQELSTRGLQIQQHSNLFEKTVWQSLRFTHDQHRRVAGAIALHQPLIQANQCVILQSRVEPNSEICHYEIK